MINRLYLTRLLCTAALSCVALPVMAQTNIEEDEEVPTLVRQAKKQAASEALVTASLFGETGVRFVDNIYRSPTNEESDGIAFIRPGVLFRTHDDGYVIKARAELERGQYFTESRNNYTDADFRLDGSTELSPYWSVNGRARYGFDHVAIGAFIDDPDRQATEPTFYRRGEFGLGTTGRMDDLRIDLDAQASTFDYDNTDAFANTTIINEDRNRNEYELSARPGYYVTTDTLLYVKGTVNWRDYDKMIDGTALHSLDSSGYEAVAGIQKGSLEEEYYLNVNLGYLSQDYDDDFREDVDGLAANANLQWDVLPELTLIGVLSRSVEESTLADSSGYLRTRVGGGAEYHFQPQWTASGLLRYTNYDFEINNTNGRPSREDHIVDLNLGLTYDITEIYHAGVEYGFVTRNSDDATVEYDANSLMLRLFATY